MKHGPRFEKLCEEARRHIHEITINEVQTRLGRGDRFFFIDTREESEWCKSRLPQAFHMGKGVIERDIEAQIPDTNAEIVLYCGGGYRSALAAENLKKMGYTRVTSMAGGFRGWKDKGLPIVTDEPEES